MTQRFACQGSGRFAAYAVVITTMAEGAARNCSPRGPVSVLMVAGTEWWPGPRIPWDGGEVRKGRHRGKGGKVIAAREALHHWADLD